MVLDFYVRNGLPDLLRLSLLLSFFLLFGEIKLSNILFGDILRDGKLCSE